MTTPGTARGAMIAAFEETLRHERGYSDNTVRAYGSDLVHLVRFASGSPVDAAPVDADAVLSSVTLADLRSWLAAMAEAGLSRTTLARRGAAARTFFAWATDAGLVVTNPAARLASARPAQYAPHRPVARGHGRPSRSRRGRRGRRRSARDARLGGGGDAVRHGHARR